jgi:hypothetical protein
VRGRKRRGAFRSTAADLAVVVESGAAAAPAAAVEELVIGAAEAAELAVPTEADALL